MAAIPVKLKTYDGSESNGEVTTREFSNAEVIKRTLTKSGFVLFLTILAVFIPGLHFILVPLGLIITLIMFFRILAIKSIIEESTVHCPSCKQEIRIFERPQKFPFSDSCESCHREVFISAQ